MCAIRKFCDQRCIYKSIGMVTHIFMPEQKAPCLRLLDDLVPVLRAVFWVNPREHCLNDFQHLQPSIACNVWTVARLNIQLDGPGI